MKTQSINYSKQTCTRLSVLALALCAFLMYGCGNQPTDPGMITDTSMEKPVSSLSLSELDPVTIEGTMQFSPHKINLQSVGASESVIAIIGLSIPGGFHLADYDFTLSFDGQDVTTAYDCYYCYIDDNLIISFDKSAVIASPVTLSYAGMKVVAAVNGYFRVESDTDGYNTTLSTVANVEILAPAHSGTVADAAGTTLGQ